MNRLKKSLFIGGIVGVPLLGLAAGWAWWLPGFVRSRAGAAVEDRFGVEATIDEASVGVDGVRLGGVRLLGRSGGLELGVEQVLLEASPWALLTRGKRSLRAVDVEGLSIELDLSDGGVRRSLEAVAEGLRRGGGEGSAPSRRGSLGDAGLSVSVVDFGLSIRDELGELGAIRGGNLSSRGGNIRGGAHEAQLGGESGDELHFIDVEGELDRTEHGWRVAGFSLGGGDVTFASRAEAFSAEGEGAEESALESTRARVERLFALLRGISKEEVEVREGEEAAGPHLTERLEEGGRLSVNSLQIWTRTENGDDLILRGLSGEVEAEGDGRFHLVGGGTTDGEGSLQWDLHVEPSRLRGEGSVAFRELPLAILTPLMPAIPWYEPERARLDGELTVSADSPAELSFEGHVELRQGALASSRIAPEPVFDINLGAEGTGRWIPGERRVELSSATLRMSGAEARLSGALEWTSAHYLVNVHANLPPTRCATALGAIPPDLLGGLAGFGWQGRIGARLIVRVDSRDLDATELNVRIADGCRFESVPPMADLRRVQRPFRHEVLEPDGTIFAMRTGPGTANWTSIHAISPFFLQSVISHEDGAFFRHSGFSVGSIRDALVRNLREGRYVVGASTITMQLAKNLFLHREKTLARKVQEALLTWWLESALSKQDILELYVNVIEYGPSVYGIRNAAWHYFGRDPGQLSPAESAFLAAVLPNPKLFHTSYERGRLTTAMRNRMGRQLRHMHSRGRIDALALASGLLEIESFRFHADGQAPAPARVISGHAAPLPFATIDAAADEWEWEGAGETPPMTGLRAPAL